MLLKYDLFGVQHQNQVTKSINNNKSYGGKLVVSGNNWLTISEDVPNNHLKRGLNQIFFNRKADEFYAYQVKNVSLELKAKHTNELILTSETLVNYQSELFRTPLSCPKSL